MPRIKIKDLNMEKTLTPEILQGVRGGFEFSGTNYTSRWMPGGGRIAFLAATGNAGAALPRGVLPQSREAGTFTMGRGSRSRATLPKTGSPRGGGGSGRYGMWATYG